MAKDGKKSSTTNTPEQLARRKWEAEQWELGRYEWLNARAPMAPLTVLAPMSPTAATIDRAETGGGPQERRLKPILRRRWPPNGQPPASLSQKEIVASVNDVYGPLYKRDAKRTTILRVIKALAKSIASPV
jgi:hypothetical protein